MVFMEKSNIKKNNFYNIIYKGSYQDISIDILRDKFEFLVTTYNSNIFLFKSEFPSMVSILKRIVLYYFIFIFLFSSYFLINLDIFNNLFYFIIKFFIISNFLIIFCLIFFYLLNSLLVNYKTELVGGENV